MVDDLLYTELFYKLLFFTLFSIINPCLMPLTFVFAEIKIQPELNNKLIPSHYRGEPANSSSGGGGSSAVDSSEGAAAAAVNDN